MLKPLRRIKNSCWHFANGQRVEGPHNRLTGYVSGLTGDVSGISLDARKEHPEISYWVEDSI